MKMIQKLLFLDDIRCPEEAYHYTKQDFFLLKDWIIVRNYKQFIHWISEKGLPEMISFDHDLADGEHTGNWDSEKTGYDCAKWLIEYCMDHHLDVPQFYSHSMNPVGKKNIINLLENFRRQNELFSVDLT
ncbi:cyclic-phosphate processing receiver domain-containing protein [Chryseobacterium sp. LAM-KRS1]|uniref:cyclic-phosphate processing receiver domain-containing protein n=1 Tax=Chryseobacterium sp. LAM-KRS1 TaxID=2715754 RepID=UPI0015563081|nr:cyclic-phosphate processing receiver domain-containing protein [Chryseobacterium sp. LAM-KRS1]